MKDFTKNAVEQQAAEEQEDDSSDADAELEKMFGKRDDNKKVAVKQDSSDSDAPA